jgi:hypothetical protein
VSDTRLAEDTRDTQRVGKRGRATCHERCRRCATRRIAQVSINGARDIGGEYPVRDSDEEFRVVGLLDYATETPAPTTAMRLMVMVTVGRRDGTRNTNSLCTKHTQKHSEDTYRSGAQNIMISSHIHSP